MPVAVPQGLTKSVRNTKVSQLSCLGAADEEPSKRDVLTYVENLDLPQTQREQWVWTCD